MYVNWLDQADQKNIYVNEKVYTEWKDKIGNRIELHYGTLKIPRKLEIDGDLPDDCISLSHRLTKDITLPKDVLYEVRMNGNQLFIGPLIGIMVSKYQKDLTCDKLEILKERVSHYEKIKGVVFVSTHDLIDVLNHQMKGFYYEKAGVWKEGVFPFPKVLINRPYMKKSLLKKIMEKDQITIVNNCNMTKDKFWRILSNNTNVNCYLPFTQRLMGINTILDMLNTYEKVYIKPSNSSRGRGIYCVNQTANGILIKGGRNKEITVENKEELSVFFEKLIKKRRYIIQQGVPFQVGERLIDFRLYMQKDDTLDWNCSGIYGRVAKLGSIVTNLKHSQEIVTFEKGLRKFFALQKEEIMKMEDQMKLVSKKICKALEEQGQIIADVALDMVIDQQQKIWVLEVQVNYANDERLYQLPPEIYKKVWETPLQYAKALLSFSEIRGRSR